MTDQELAIMKRFLTELMEEEEANGSSFLAREFKELSENVEELETVEEVSAKVFESYFKFHEQEFNKEVEE